MTFLIVMVVKKDIKILFPLLFLFVFLSTDVLSQMTNEDRVYIDMVVQKSTASTSAKIDGQITRMEGILTDNLEKAKGELRQMIVDDFKKSMKAIAIGLSGMIIVSLAIFKIVDVKLNHTRNIQKYEKDLQEKIKNYDELTKKNEEFKQKLIIYKNSLVQREIMINKYAPQGMAMQPLNQPQYANPTPEKKSGKTLLKIILIILILGCLATVGYLGWFYFLRGG